MSRKDNPNPTPPYYGNTLPVICGITLEDLRKLYAELKSVKRVAKKLNFSVKSTSKWLRIAGVHTLGHRPTKPITPSQQTEYGAVAKWIQSHPGEKLPSSYKECAILVGCSESSIKAFMRRRRVKAQRYLDSFGPLNKFNFTLESLDRRLVNVRYLDSFSYKIHTKTFEVHLVGFVHSRKFEFKLPYKELLDLVRKEYSAKT